MNSTDQSIQSNKSSAKSIFASRTFWGVVLSGIASLVPLATKAIKEHNFGVDAAGQVVLILCGLGTAIVGRVDARSPVYTPDGLPGPNKSDFAQ